MKDDRARCRSKGCSRKVGTMCCRCGQLACSKHSIGVGVARMCHNCLADQTKSDA